MLFFDKQDAVISLKHATQHLFPLFELPAHANENGIGSL